MDSPALETGLLTPDPREVPPPPRSSLNIGCAQKFYAAIDAAGKALSEPQPVMAPRSQFSTADPTVSACHRSFLPAVPRRCTPQFRQADLGLQELAQSLKSATRAAAGRPQPLNTRKKSPGGLKAARSPAAARPATRVPSSLTGKRDVMAGHDRVRSQ